MRQRTLGPLGPVSEIGYGMWGMGGWTGSDDEESARRRSTAAFALGCNFFDTAWVYGHGKSERLLGGALRRNPTGPRIWRHQVPPKNMMWPAAAGCGGRGRVSPGTTSVATRTRAWRTLGVSRIDLQQFHVWSDDWSSDAGWQRAVRDLKDSGMVRAFGISVNRWEPENVLRALDTGLIDSVQVVYNIFDQAPEDTLFPLLPATRDRHHCARPFR